MLSCDIDRHHGVVVHADAGLALYTSPQCVTLSCYRSLMRMRQSSDNEQRQEKSERRNADRSAAELETVEQTKQTTNSTHMGQAAQNTTRVPHNIQKKK